ncbi:hypothetical protein [Kitasatospora sp. NPDC093102]|uniref:hypothetical protein n=1 Tax=Kitasatospora sp. NPDC093102 TaxID=3155069 RepID=UPI003431997C
MNGTPVNAEPVELAEDDLREAAGGCHRRSHHHRPAVPDPADDNFGHLVPGHTQPIHPVQPQPVHE